MSTTKKATPAAESRPTDARLHPVVSHVADRLEAAGATATTCWDNEGGFLAHLVVDYSPLEIGKFYAMVIEVCGHLAQSLTFDLPADVRTRHEDALKFAQDPRNLRSLFDGCALEIERRAKAAKAAKAAAAA